MISSSRDVIFMRPGVTVKCCVNQAVFHCSRFTHLPTIAARKNPGCFAISNCDEGLNDIHANPVN
jgi:hypothetical protein